MLVLFVKMFCFVAIGGIAPSYLFLQLFLSCILPNELTIQKKFLPFSPP